MGDASHNPFVGSPPENVLLPRAPLVRVIAQVRHSPVLKLKKGSDFLAEVQDLLRGDYPGFSEEQNQEIHLLPDGTARSIDFGHVWRMAEASGDWRISIAQNYVSLEAIKYSDRDDFVQRLNAVVGCLEKVTRPGHAERIGVRYVSRILPPELDRIEQLIRPHVLGVQREEAFKEYGQHVITESTAKVDEGILMGRWGRLPPNSTIDSNIMQPVPTASWIFDVDVHTVEPLPFKAPVLTPKLQACAERCYSMFRWLVEDEFLTAYGGEI